MIANRSEKGILIPEQKQMDYFLIIKEEEIKEEKVTEIIKKIKEMTLVQTAVRIEASTLKSKQNLIL